MSRKTSLLNLHSFKLSPLLFKNAHMKLSKEDNTMENILLFIVNSRNLFFSTASFAAQYVEVQPTPTGESYLNTTDC